MVCKIWFFTIKCKIIILCEKEVQMHKKKSVSERRIQKQKGTGCLPAGRLVARCSLAGAGGGGRKEGLCGL